MKRLALQGLVFGAVLLGLVLGSRELAPKPALAAPAHPYIQRYVLAQGVVAGGGCDATQSCSVAALSATTGSFSDAVGFANGTAGAPSIAFTADQDGSGTGWYRIGANNPGLSTNGTLRFSISATGTATFSGQVEGAIFKSSFLDSTTNAAMDIQGRIANGGTANGIRLANSVALTTDGACTASFYPDAFTTKVACVDKDGKWTTTTGTAYDTMGRAVMVGGTVTVATTAVEAASVIILTRCVTGGTEGMIRVGTVTADTSFIIESASGADTSTVCWHIMN